MVGVNGGKFPAIRNHLEENIGGVYKDMDLSLVLHYHTRSYHAAFVYFQI